MARGGFLEADKSGVSGSLGRGGSFRKDSVRNTYLVARNSAGAWKVDVRLSRVALMPNTHDPTPSTQFGYT